MANDSSQQFLVRNLTNQEVTLGDLVNVRIPPRATVDLLSFSKVTKDKIDKSQNLKLALSLNKLAIIPTPATNQEVLDNLYPTTGTGSGSGSGGLTGPIGLSGPPGVDGQGLTGSQGLTGVFGLTGAQGVTGLTGIQGASGVQGLTGTQGITGLTGIQGASGAQGLTGIQAASGVHGLTGSVGGQGITGLTGTIGSGGVQGLTGTFGLTGVQGITGLTGIQGLTGVFGLTGSGGAGGITGLTGPIGGWLTGPQGLTGAGGVGGTGITGPYGISGPAGSGGGVIEFWMDAGSSVISTGQKNVILVGFNCTINTWEIVADQSGSIIVDVWKTDYAGYPPTNSNSITNGNEPTLSSAVKTTGTTSGWTTSTITAGDYIRIYIDSVSTLTKVLFSMKVTKT